MQDSHIACCIVEASFKKTFGIIPEFVGQARFQLIYRACRFCNSILSGYSPFRYFCVSDFNQIIFDMSRICGRGLTPVQHTGIGGNTNNLQTTDVTSISQNSTNYPTDILLGGKGFCPRTSEVHFRVAPTIEPDIFTDCLISAHSLCPPSFAAMI